MLDHVTCPGSSLPLSNMAYDKVLALSKSNGKMDFYVAQMMQQWYNDPNKHLAILHYLQLLCHCESLSEMVFFFSKHCSSNDKNKSFNSSCVSFFAILL